MLPLTPARVLRFAAAALLVACEAGSENDSPTASPPASPPDRPARQDIVTTDLALDVGTRTGRATLVVRPAADASEVALDVTGLTVIAVTRDGVEVEADVRDGLLRVPVPAASASATIAVEYTFPERTPRTFDGWMPGLGVSFVWPDRCGNLFPCDPSPVDGVTFTLAVTGQDPSLDVVYAASTYGDGPSYMPGLAVGDYAELDLGVTRAGTRLKAWYFDVAGRKAIAEAGTEHLREGFDFFEQTYGPYHFGPESGSVEVDWGADSWGGMEHHPYSHIATFDMGTEEVHLHEAAHGWFGDAVRLACWEDFVLSEGTVTYMAARAAEETGAGDLWVYYVDYFLEPICRGADLNPIVWPADTCNAIDISTDDIWSLATYMKGACFYEEVADEVGADVVDAAIADMYAAHVGDAARMEDMVAALEARVPEGQRDAVTAAADAWLLTEACPEDYAARCGAHDW